MKAGLAVSTTRRFLIEERTREAETRKSEFLADSRRSTQGFILNY